MTYAARLIGAGLAVWLGGAVLSCSPRAGGERPEDRDGGAGSVVGAPAGEADTARLARLEREARALAKQDGCGASAQCRTAPVGSRPCGGPRDYLAYCAATTDSAALFRTLDELARAEEEYNRAAGMMSTCEFRMPPTVSATAGRCTVTTGVP